MLAHELGHVKNRDGLRNLIYNGGTSFLIGLLVRRRHRLQRHHLRQPRAVSGLAFARGRAHRGPTTIDVMRKLGRSPKPMGEFLLRVTGKEKGKGLALISSHPLSEDRLARMSQQDSFADCAAVADGAKSGRPSRRSASRRQKS